MNEIYRVFHFNKYNVTINPGATMQLKITYSPLLENEKSSDLFNISARDSPDAEKIRLLGKCLGKYIYLIDNTENTDKHRIYEGYVSYISHKDQLIESIFFGIADNEMEVKTIFFIRLRKSKCLSILILKKSQCNGLSGLLFCPLYSDILFLILRYQSQMFNEELAFRHYTHYQKKSKGF